MYRIEALNPNGSLIFPVPSYEIVIAGTPSRHLRQTSYDRNRIRCVEFRKNHLDPNEHGSSRTNETVCNKHLSLDPAIR